MDPDHVIFVKVVEAGSLSAAARNLLISPAMVSKRLARLEARLGGRLLHRTTRKLVLTEVGSRLYTDLGGILQALREAESRVAGDILEPAGTLRVSAPTSFGRMHIAPQLHAFLNAYPRIRLEFEVSDAYVDLFDGRTDLAIRIASETPPSLTAHRLSGNRRILCASPEYLAKHGVPATVSALAEHRLLAAEGQLPWRLIRAGRRVVVEGRSHVRTSSSEIVRELALTGVGIALRSMWDVNDLLDQKRLVPVLPGWEAPSDLSIFAVYPRSPTIEPTVNAFIGFLTETLDVGPWEHSS